MILFDEIFGCITSIVIATLGSLAYAYSLGLYHYRRDRASKNDVRSR